VLPRRKLKPDKKHETEFHENKEGAVISVDVTHYLLQSRLKNYAFCTKKKKENSTKNQCNKTSG